ncbi:MAG: NADH-quinone oxidoreductase subunit N [Armatimonadetes bacterium]|nr:NADH-quinone oxidoreductase subunit N [Armatimonadota bacterium]
MFNFPAPTIDWVIIAPTMIVSITGLLALCLEMIWPKRDNTWIIGVSLVGLIMAAVSVVAQFSYPEATTFSDTVIRDRFALVMQLLLIVAAFCSLLFSESYLRDKRISYGEFYPIILWSLVGGMVMVTTRNMLLMFLGIEILSIALYVLAGLSRSESKSEESALKYFLLGSFASGFLLYGVALLYGATGSLDISAIASAWPRADLMHQTLLVFGFGMVFVGLGFKSAFVPFHQWTPDVYQGAPTNVSAFMAAGSKIGALAALWRFLEGAEGMKAIWMPALTVVAILTMTAGNLAALVQKDAKRVLGYSSISHAGYILVGILAHFAAPDKVGFGSLAYYLLSYTLMTVGAFAVVSLGANKGKEGTKFEELRGLWRRSPFAVACLIVFVASLIGIPLTSGFAGKFMIFGDALKANLTVLAIALAINSILSVAYYLQMIKAMFVDDVEGDEVIEKRPVSLGMTTVCALCAGGIVAAFIFTPVVIEFLVGKS